MECRRAGAKGIAKGGTVRRIRRAFRKGGSGPERRIRRARRESLPSRPLPRKKSAPFLRGGGIFFVPGRIPSGARTPRTTPTGGLGALAPRLGGKRRRGRVCAVRLLRLGCGRDLGRTPRIRSRGLRVRKASRRRSSPASACEALRESPRLHGVGRPRSSHAAHAGNFCSGGEPQGRAARAGGRLPRRGGDHPASERPFGRRRPLCSGDARQGPVAGARLSLDARSRAASL